MLTKLNCAKLNRPLLIISTLILTTILASCGGGGSDDSDPLSTNTCSTLGLNTRIINGTECSSSGSPVLAINLINRSGSGSLCSGTLITPNQVLTAAHCFITEPVRSAFVEVDGERIFGARVRVHPNATLDPISKTALNDVAVLDLDETVNRPTVALVTSVAALIGDRFAIYGFGLDSNGELGVLRSGEMEISDITPNHIIADFEGDGSNTCNGDSGGPAIFSLPNNGGFGLIGVTSSGTAADCQEGDHSYFANLQSPTVASFILDVAPSTRQQ